MNNQKYPSPRKDEQFKAYWHKMIDKVVERDNFHQSHLEQLRLLCDLFVDYDNLTQFVKENGWTYETCGRSGNLVKEYPQVSLRNKCFLEIRNYLKMLDIVLVKDNTQKEEDCTDWD